MVETNAEIKVSNFLWSAGRQDDEQHSTLNNKYCLIYKVQICML